MRLAQPTGSRIPLMDPSLPSSQLLPTQSPVTPVPTFSEPPLSVATESRSFPPEAFRPSTRIITRGAVWWGSLSAVRSFHPLLAQGGAIDAWSEIEDSADQGPVVARAASVLRDVTRQARPPAELFHDLNELRSLTKDTPWLAPQERLARAILYFRMGRLQRARKTLTRALEKPEYFDGTWSVLLQLTLADVQIGEAVLGRGRAREEGFHDALRTIRVLTEAAWRAKISPSMKRTVAEALSAFASVYYDAHFYAEARYVAQCLHRYFRQSSAARRLADPEQSPIGSLLVPAYGGLLPSKTSAGIWAGLLAGAKEFVVHAKTDKASTFWGTAVLGGLIGMAVNGGGGSGWEFVETLQSMAEWGLGSVFAVKAWFGLRAPETRNAFSTGYSALTTRETLGNVLNEAGKAAATYAFLGGELPAVGFLPQPFLAYALPDGSGALNGLGSATAGLYSLLSRHGKDLASLMQTMGFSEGFEFFATNLRHGTIWGSSFGNALDATAEAMRWIAGTLNEVGSVLFHPGRLVDAGRAALQGAGTMLARSVEGPREMLSAGLVAATGISLYYMGRMTFSPEYRRRVEKGEEAAFNRVFGWVAGAVGTVGRNPELKAAIEKDPKLALAWTEIFMLGLSYIAAVELGIASDMTPANAMITPLVCYIGFLRMHGMSGGKFTVKGLHWVSLAMSALVQYLYLKPGSAMRSDIAPVTALDYYAENAALVWFLATIGVFHAVLTQFRVAPVMLSKYFKAVTWEALQNMAKLWAGWNTPQAMALQILIRDGVFGPTVTQSIREPSGSNPQRHTITTAALGLHKEAVKAEAASFIPQIPVLTPEAVVLRTALKASGRRWFEAARDAAAQNEDWAHWRRIFLKRPPHEGMLRLTDFYFAPQTPGIYLPAVQDVDAYRTTAFRALLSEKTPPEVVGNFLSRLAVIAADDRPARAPAREALVLCAFAARRGPHAGAITAFFADHPWIVHNYRLNEDEAPPKKWRSVGARKWFIENRRRDPVTAKAQDFEDVLAQVGRVWSVLNPVRGETVSEAVVPLSASRLGLPLNRHIEPPFPTRPDPFFWRLTLFHILMDPKGDPFAVDGLLAAARHIIPPRQSDARYDVRRNLLLTLWAAAEGPHGERIREFLDENKEGLEYYGLAGLNDRPNSENSLACLTWFQRHLIGSDATADGRIREDDARRGDAREEEAVYG